MEYRFLTGENSRIFIFTDSGYFLWDTTENHGVRKNTELALGYGFGMRINTRLGMLGLDYGLAHGEKITGGKVHLGIENRF